MPYLTCFMVWRALSIFLMPLQFLHPFIPSHFIIIIIVIIIILIIIIIIIISKLKMAWIRNAKYNVDNVIITIMKHWWNWQVFPSSSTACSVNLCFSRYFPFSSQQWRRLQLSRLKTKWDRMQGCKNKNWSCFLHEFSTSMSSNPFSMFKML